MFVDFDSSVILSLAVVCVWKMEASVSSWASIPKSSLISGEYSRDINSLFPLPFHFWLLCQQNLQIHVVFLAKQYKIECYH